MIYMHISDIHFLHEITKTRHIVNGLERMFYHDYKKEFDTIEYLFISGDIFHKLAMGNSDDYRAAIYFLTRLMIKCGKKNIKVVVLEGTPSHDNKQFTIVMDIIKSTNINVDCTYIQEPTLLTLGKEKLKCMFIPDEIATNHIKGTRIIEELFLKNKLKQVDLMFIHDQFNFQIPYSNPLSSYNEKVFIPKVKYYIHCAHIHTYSVYKNIITGGSPDRLTHNDEGLKGMIYAMVGDGDKRFKFLVNKNTRPYITLDFNTIDLHTIKSKVKSIFKKYNIEMSIRLRFSGVTLDTNSLEVELSEDFPLVMFKSEIVKSKKENDPIDNYLPNTEFFKIDRDNLIQTLKKFKPSIEDMEVEYMQNFL